MTDNSRDSRHPRLESWKEIGAYLQRDVRTARRWELEEGLPVHRHSHRSRSSVYAYPAELDAWRASRKVVPEPPPARPLWKIPAFAVTMLLCLVMVGNGVRPVSAQQAAATARQLWLTGDEDPCCTAPSADGRYIVYTDDSTGDLGVRDLVSGTSRRLTNRSGRDFAEPTKAISPDGRMIAYAWTMENVAELRVIPTAGGTPRTVYRGKSPNEYLLPHDWTADGKQLLVGRKLADNSWQIAMVSVADGTVRPIKSVGWGLTDPQLSPDGRFIAYAAQRGGGDILLLAADGSSETTLVSGPGKSRSPIWSADGSEVLFVSNRTGAPSLWAISVRNGKPNGPAILLRADFIDKYPLGMTRTGALYYTANGNGGTNIYVADVDSALKVREEAHVATEGSFNSNLGPAISPDGERLAYFSNLPGRGRVLMVRNLKTGEEREMGQQAGANPNNSAYGPMWFPTGDSVLVYARDPNRPGYHFWRVHLGDRKREELLSLAQLWAYALSPNGKSLFYAGQETIDSTGALVRFDIESKRQTVLTLTPSGANSISVSPNNQEVAYMVGGGGPNKDGTRLEVMPASGGQSREVHSSSPWQDPWNVNGLGWTADGKSLLFVKPQNGETVLWRVPVTGGRPEPTGIVRKGQIKSPQMSPNGMQIYFGSSEPVPGELWALENFLPQTAAK